MRRRPGSLHFLTATALGAALATIVATARAQQGPGGSLLEVDLPAAKSATTELRTAVDDTLLANPTGYFPAPAPMGRVVRKITIENVGKTPITDPDIRLNGVPLLPVSEPLASLGLEKIDDLFALFTRWRDRAVHGTTDLEANKDPLVMLQAIGAGFCGDDARALAAITTAHGAEVRFARLNGHSAAEHKLGGDWMLLDGDQNLFYLGWDNRTLVSEDDILADPLLALRTQVFGRQSEWAPAAAWQNTARFEFIDHAREQKKFRLKNPPAPRHWQLLPGEKITISLDRTPKLVAAPNDALRANAALRAGTCVVEFHTKRGPSEKITLPFPVISTKAGEPEYEVTLPLAGSTSPAASQTGQTTPHPGASPPSSASPAPGSPAPILLQSARSQFPTLRRGENRLESRANGDVKVTFQLQPQWLSVPTAPSPRLENHEILTDAQGAERIWWQIADDADFRMVAPNLDRTGQYQGPVKLHPIDETFLSAGRTYYLRAKIRKNSVWSDWSETTKFVAEKPAQPELAKIEGADGDQMKITWKPASGNNDKAAKADGEGAEMLVFGSNRLDFLPEIYDPSEITRLEDGAAKATRPNQNLLATVPVKDGEAYVPVRACYRLIVREKGTLSVPSAIIRSPKAPKPTVLQNRHEKAEGALSGRDVAVELEVP